MLGLEIENESSLKRALSTVELCKLESEIELAEYVDNIGESKFVNYNKNYTYMREKYLCQAIKKLSKLVGSRVHIKLKSKERKTIETDYDFVKDCVPYICDNEDPQELSSVYPSEQVFQARLIWNTYNSQIKTFNENCDCFEKFIAEFKPLDIFTNLFTFASADVLAGMDEEEFIGYLSTCDLDTRSKDIISAIYSVLPEKYKIEAIEDIFMSQTPVLLDERIDVEERVYLGMIQMLAYNDDISQELQVGWSNVVGGKIPVDLVI